MSATRLPDPESVVGVIYHQVLVPSVDGLSSRDIQVELETLGEKIPPKTVNKRIDALFRRKLVRREKIHGTYVYYTNSPQQEIPMAKPAPNTKINPSKNIGVLYHQIMKPNKAYTARMVDEAFEKRSLIIGSSSASSMLSQLATRGYALQDKSNGVSEYTRVDEADAVPVKLDKNKGRGNKKGKRGAYGGNKKTIIASMSHYIGETFTIKEIATISNLKMSSAINGIANKLVESRQLAVAGMDGRSPLYKVLPAIAQEVTTTPNIPLTNRQAVETLVRPDFNQQPASGDPLANLAGSFQMLLEDHNKVKMYEQGFQQIAGILASMGIIEGA